LSDIQITRTAQLTFHASWQDQLTYNIRQLGENDPLLVESILDRLDKFRWELLLTEIPNRPLISTTKVCFPAPYNPNRKWRSSPWGPVPASG